MQLPRVPAAHVQHMLVTVQSAYHVAALLLSMCKRVLTLAPAGHYHVVDLRVMLMLVCIVFPACSFIEYVKDAGRLVASRDMHVCATFARRFYWSDLNL
jgi:hypothetical protein